MATKPKRAKDAGESERTIHEFTMRLPMALVDRMDAVLDSSLGERRTHLIRVAVAREVSEREAEQTTNKSSRGAKRKSK